MRRSILLVDDDATLRNVLIYELVRDAYDLTGVGTGDEALVWVSRNAVDLIILDIGLPDCSGFDLYHRLREFTKAPVIFLTARNECIDRVAGLELGAEDYLPKPFDVRELQARIRVVLRRGGGQWLAGDREFLMAAESPNTARVSSPFALDEQRMTIHYYGQIIDLTHYEYLILRLLVLNPGHVVSRAKLLDVLSGNPDGPYERVIDSHISAIRTKLRKIDPERNPISTRRNAGYVIEESSW